ncbi:glutaredoxin family protein [Iodobacter fluviatilis]|uniref:Glutaredoxin n=1 Tax=Iodobacter fluviatilis TaxID=537 RepID=A0A377Q2Y9_9NEIS|nr:glutaredoxin family protein [Iodobacter fluviatilis]TCU90118.1 glutaredoxin [Iodobacter fluviatilis]STQ89145.1 glutaredoxin-like protein, YruB-family [Iodobacter fluviatilis]
MLRLITLLIIAGVLQFTWKHYSNNKSNTEYSTNQMSQLASAVKPGEVTMYSTTECAYCSEAKSWLNQNGFAFTECNMTIDQRCQQEFNAYGAVGTPFLIVRGHQMKDGFDSDEFLQALSS